MARPPLLAASTYGKMVPVFSPNFRHVSMPHMPADALAPDDCISTNTRPALSTAPCDIQNSTPMPSCAGLGGLSVARWMSCLTRSKSLGIGRVRER